MSTYDIRKDNVVSDYTFREQWDQIPYSNFFITQTQHNMTTQIIQSTVDCKIKMLLFYVWQSSKSMYMYIVKFENS